MQFEVMKKSHKKKIIIGVSVFVAVVGLLLSRNSFAKYQTVKSFKIVDGVINYTYNPSDFEMIAMYQQKEGQKCTKDSCYDTIDRMPESGYKINENKSYCNVNGTKDNNAVLKTINGINSFSRLQKESKCYVYFDKETTVDLILGDVEVKDEKPFYGAISTSDDGVYKTQDDYGDTYYFRGAVTNNYVKFAGFYWRIIRINGDGSIRLIYDGTVPHNNGESTKDNIIKSDIKFNETYNTLNMYIGFMYTNGQVHGTTNKSTILSELETWYKNNLANYTNKIELNAGFCGDRTPSTISTTSNGEGGTGTTETFYGAYIRLTNSTKTPVLTCLKEDLYTVNTDTVNKGNKALTYPIGLISADEVAMAGGVYNTINKNYYLYNGNGKYWTISPSWYDGSSANLNTFIVGSDGDIINRNTAFNTNGIRPVINLKADTTFTFNGTGTKGSMTNPYIVE